MSLKVPGETVLPLPTLDTGWHAKWLKLDLKIRETSDAGTPITIVEPDNPHALVFRQMAARIWQKLAGADAERRPPPRIVPGGG